MNKNFIFISISLIIFIIMLSFLSRFTGEQIVIYNIVSIRNPYDSRTGIHSIILFSSGKYVIHYYTLKDAAAIYYGKIDSLKEKEIRNKVIQEENKYHLSENGYYFYINNDRDDKWGRPKAIQYLYQTIFDDDHIDRIIKNTLLLSEDIQFIASYPPIDKEIPIDMSSTENAASPVPVQFQNDNKNENDEIR